MKSTENFNVAITCRHEEFGDGFKELIQRQLHKLSKFHSNIIDATVTIDKQNSNFRVEILLHVPGSVITAAYEDYNHIKAFDSAIEKVKTQIKKLKSKVIDHRISVPLIVAETEESEEFDDFE